MTSPRPRAGSVLGILALTHSSRRANLARCSVQFLTRRFGDPERLRDLPPFDGLPPAAPLYSGAASFYRVHADERQGVRLAALGSLRSRDRIQHVALRGPDELLVGYEHRLERWRLRTPLDRLDRLAAADLVPAGRIEHPHLAGLHTVELLPDGRAALACADADAVLLCDLGRGTVESTLRLPATLYGQGYSLTTGADLRRHAIPDEAQTTHVNAAHRAGPRHLVVSTLIQGAIGTFDLGSGAYTEISRGFVGCHGARLSHQGEIYFADSACGTLVFLTAAGGVARRFATGSRWLHDVQQLAGDLYAFALADSNELRIYDVASGALLWRRRFLTWPLPFGFGAGRRLPGWLGNSTQALSFRPAAGDGLPPPPATA